MTDTERISFLETHRCSQFLSEKGVWVVQLGDRNPMHTTSGCGFTLGDAIDCCRELNFDETGKWKPMKVVINDPKPANAAPVAALAPPEAPKTCLDTPKTIKRPTPRL